MLYYVLVYECVLVQMLSARSGMLSFNRLSNHLFPTDSVVVLQVSCHLCHFELRLNHFAFVNILCSFIVMIPLGLNESFVLAPYTSSCSLYICNIGHCSRKLTVSPNSIFNEYTCIIIIWKAQGVTQ